MAILTRIAITRCIMSKPPTNDQKNGEKTLYICPCGFCSYDLMEFLKHRYMGDEPERNEEELRKNNEQEK